jgi:hypothetical protein
MGCCGKSNGFKIGWCKLNRIYYFWLLLVLLLLWFAWDGSISRCRRRERRPMEWIAFFSKKFKLRVGISIHNSINIMRSSASSFSSFQERHLVSSSVTSATVICSLLLYWHLRYHRYHST